MKPPLGMVPYLPTHSHMPDEPCPGEVYCPYVQWHNHIKTHGNPYAVLVEIMDGNASLVTQAEEYVRMHQ